MTEKKNLSVYHVELLDPQEGERQHTYFGSLAAIFDVYTRDRLGISYNGVRKNCDLRQETVYKNKHCIIRSGVLVTKKQQSKHQKDEDRQTER